MAELISLCGRNGVIDSYTAVDLKTIVDQILPSNAPRETDIVRDDGVLTCRINFPDSSPTVGTTTCLGQMIPPTDNWHESGAPRPDGSYGIVRANTDAIELVADETASRTIYYRLFEDLLVASTSQRAIAHFADEFVLNEAAVAWMISSGNLGPSQVWDTRINHVPPGSVVRLDRSKWEVAETTREVVFDPIDEPVSVHRKQLIESIDSTFAALDVDTDRWELPLSGGLDSREILIRLQDRDNLQTLTWGTEAALDDPESDAVRARELAQACDVPHRYYTLPDTPKDVEEVFDRFVTAGEGRIDHISAYTDGFGVFEDLASRNVDGLVRGNEGFGWRPAGSSATVRDIIGAEMIDDYETLPDLSIPGHNRQHLPKRLQRSSNESLSTWRDRLYHTYRIPVILGALTSLKTPYVEVVNPFLTQRIMETVRRLPDEMRTNKQLYADYVQQRSPDVPIAKRSAIPDGAHLLARDSSKEFLHSQLDTEHARSVLGNKLIEYAIEEIKVDRGADGSRSGDLLLDAFKRQIGHRLPLSVVRLIESYTPVQRPSLSISGSQLAFRLYIIETMVEHMTRDVDRL